MPRLTGAIHLPEQTAPSSGTAGRVIVYAQSNGQIYTKDSAGATRQVLAFTDGKLPIANISATGTPSSTTYLRGDGTWSETSNTTKTSWAGKNLYTYGHSFLAEQNTTDLSGGVSDYYSRKFATALGINYPTAQPSGVNGKRAVAGSVVVEAANEMNSRQPYVADSKAVFLIQALLNTSRTFAAGTPEQTQSLKVAREALKSLLANAYGLQRYECDTDPMFVRDASTWSTVTSLDYASGGTILRSNTPNAKLSWTMPSNGGWLIFTGRATGPVYTFKNETTNTVLGTFDSANLAPANSAIDTATVVNCAFYFDVAAGQTVSISKDSTTTFLIVDHFISKNTNPPIVIGVKDPFQANYSLAGTNRQNGTDANVTLFNNLWDEMAALTTQFPGLRIYNPNTGSYNKNTDISSDGVHLNTLGHQHFANDLVALADEMRTVATGPTNMVTTDTVQTIAGNKDFTGTLTRNGTAVALTNDSRFTDSRTPTAHAASHASGGTDPVTLAISQVTNLGTELSSKYSSTNTVPLTGLSATGTRDATTFLRGDNTWATPSAAAPSNMVTTDTTQTISGAKTFSLAPIVPDSSFAASKLTATGTRDATTYLRGDNTWAANVTTTDTTQTISGAKTFSVSPVVPDSSFAAAKLSATGTRDGTTFLRGDNTWAVPPAGSGGTPSNMMTTDTNQNVTNTKWFAAATAASSGATGINGSTLGFRGSYWTGTAAATSTGATLRWMQTGGSDNGYIAAEFAPFVGTVGLYDGASNAAANRVYSLNNKVPVAGLSATGTADATTYLRGDNTWATVSAAAPTNMVTTNTAQDISAAKTFSLVGGATGATRAINLVRGARIDLDNSGDAGYIQAEPTAGQTFTDSAVGDSVWRESNTSTFRFGHATSGGAAQGTSAWLSNAEFGTSVPFHLIAEYANGAPPTPTSGTLLYNRTAAGRRMLSQVGPSGISTAYQPNIFSNKVGLYTAAGGTATTAIGLQITTAGTPTVRNLHQTAASAALVNIFTSARRIGFVTAAAASSSAGARQGNPHHFVGAAANLGGFFFCIRFGISQYATGARFFTGMAAANANLGLASDASTTLNHFGLVMDAADTTFSICSNGATNTPIKVALGANFPGNTLSVDLYEFRIFAAPGSSTVQWSIERLNTGNYQEGTYTTTAASRPAANVAITPHIAIGTGAGTTAVGVDMVSMYVESDN